MFIACGLAFMRLTRENRRPNPFVESIWTWWTLLAVGFILVVLSFPVYLLLDSARGLWRTQFLSGIGAGLVLAAVCGLTSQAFVLRTAKIGLFLGFGAVIAFSAVPPRSKSAQSTGRSGSGIGRRWKRS